MGLHTLPEHGDTQHWTQRAADWGLSAYDACYLDTALAQRVPLAPPPAQLETLSQAPSRLRKTPRSGFGPNACPRAPT